MPARPAARLHPRGMTNPIGPPTNSLAKASLVMAFVFPLVGLILGLVAYDQIDASGEAGRKYATAGIAVSSVLIVLVVLAGGVLVLGYAFGMVVWMLSTS
jgi:hypothetical protein